MKNIKIVVPLLVLLGITVFAPQTWAQSSQVREDIFSRIDNDRSFGPYEIEIDARYGTVTLNGKVGDAKARAAAENYARQAAGVREVINNLEIDSSLGPVISEERSRKLHEEIRRVISQEQRLKNLSINVAVNRGVATIEGSVAQDADRRIVEEKVAAIEGIDRVINNLTTTPGISDQELRGKVVAAIKKDPVVGSSLVDVAVDSGIVSLQGDIPDHRVRDRILAITLNIEGVRDVRSSMR